MINLGILITESLGYVLNLLFRVKYDVRNPAFVLLFHINRIENQYFRMSGDV
jgi:hypothetical protein